MSSNLFEHLAEILRVISVADALDLTGDCRDEIVLWDEKRMYIYTQDGEAPAGELEYCPLKYPHYNASNYRGEYAFPRWIRRK